MIDQPEKLEAKKIMAALSPPNRRYLTELKVLETIDSTNSYLLSAAKKGSGWVCLAEQQTAGRGRQGKEWFSPYATNIYCSLSWSFPASFPGLSALSMACAGMIIQALGNMGLPAGLGLKWPNDVLFSGRKLAGILLENQVSAEQHFLVMGIGLNLYLPEEKRKAWIGVEEALGSPLSRNTAAGILLDELFTGILLFEKQGLKPFLPLCRHYDVLMGKEVLLQTPTSRFSGRVSGINEQGELLLLDAEKNEQRFCYGEVSLAGLS